MNTRMIFYGHIFQLFFLHRIASIMQPSNNIRVTYTHEVRHSNLLKFKHNIQYLQKIRSPITPYDFLKIYKHKLNINNRYFLPTFDDGFLASYEAAKQILDPLGIKAIFFVPTAIFDHRSTSAMRHFVAKNILGDSRSELTLQSDEFELMNEFHIKDLARNGHMICPHTHTHISLADITNEAIAYQELIKPKKVLEDLLNITIDAFAFPKGTERHGGAFAYDIIRKNYRFCFTALSGVIGETTNPYYLYRNHLPDDAPLSYVRLFNSSSYDLYHLYKTSLLKKITI